MDKYVILLPMNYNDGSPIPETMTQAAISELYVLAGGYTIEGRVMGAYRMKNGQKQEDLLLKIAVLVPADLLEDLRTLVRRFCVLFRQECIWLEKSNSTIELVEPSPSQGETGD